MRQSQKSMRWKKESKAKWNWSRRKRSLKNLKRILKRNRNDPKLMGDKKNFIKKEFTFFKN